MPVTHYTRSGLIWRRSSRTTANWESEGYHRVAENGDPLWKLHRGDWTRKRIVDVRIAPNGLDLWIKVE